MQVLGLNAAAGMVGKPGGLFLSPAGAESSPLSEVQKLIERMNAGQVQVLFIHGANPVFELPASLGFVQALGKVKQVISFASFPDETALMADWVLPDHTPLEGWGYQRTLAGSDRPLTSAAQPVVVPIYDTRATADVLLSAGKLPYRDEVDFIQKKIAPLLDSTDGNFTAPEIATFWSLFLQHGGWWNNRPGLQTPELAAGPLDQPAAAAQLKAPGEGEFHLVTYPTLFGDGSGANRPWLQETPNPDTTVMWNSWVEINPATAAKLGVRDDDVVLVQSASGAVEAVVYLYPALRPDTVAMPFGQGHTALGRYAQGRGANPAGVLQPLVNQAGDLAFGDTLVKITPTGKRRPISRYESREGVYGENNKPLNQ
jgi:anaerobic selenocysteine-containing dehydrogenase